MKYKNIPFTLEALEDGVKFTFDSATRSPILASYDNGETWKLLSANKTKILKRAETVALKSYFPSEIRIEDNDHTFNAYGNIMSLFLGSDFLNEEIIAVIPSPKMSHLFEETNIVNASNLILSATTLSEGCYKDMFCSCKRLVTAPALPATALADSCYESMFQNCTSLTTAPKLPATTLADRCYAFMFYDCTSLTTAPELPATTLAEKCYTSMFSNCINLTIAPKLPATTLANACYQYMFSCCKNLRTILEFPTAIKVLPTVSEQQNCYKNMFIGCTSLT